MTARLAPLGARGGRRDAGVRRDRPPDAAWPIVFMPDGSPVGTRTDDLDITRIVVYAITEQPYAQDV